MDSMYFTTCCNEPEYYRAFPIDAIQNKELVNQSKLQIPVLVLEADFYPVFGGAVQGLPAVNAVKAMAQNVTGMKVPLSGHWIPEEQPDFVIKQLANFFGNNAVTNAVTRQSRSCKLGFFPKSGQK